MAQQERLGRNEENQSLSGFWDAIVATWLAGIESFFTLTQDVSKQKPNLAVNLL